MNIEEFKKAYLSILLESVNNDKIEYSPKEYEDFLNALENIHFVYESTNIINESVENNKLIDEIFNCKNNQNFSKERLIELVDKNWIAYERFKSKCIDLKIFKIDFLNENAFKNILEVYFWHLNDQKQLKKYCKILKERANNCAGFTLNLNDVYFIFLNTNKYTYETCMHEFSHYLKDLNIDFNEDEEKEVKKFDKDKLRYLNLNDKVYEFIEKNLNSNELYPYLFEFIHTLKNVYEKFYLCNKYVTSKSEFIDYVIFCLTRTTKNPLDYEIVKRYVEVNDDISSILIFIGSFMFMDDFDKIKAFVKNEFLNY